MMRKTVNLLFLLSCTLAIAAVNVKDYGAVGDGRHVDTPAINKAIDDASKEGDTVVIPAGTYMCYSIHLKSGITLRLEKGAVLKADKRKWV